MNGQRPSGFAGDERAILDAAAKLRVRGYKHVANLLRLEIYRAPGDHAGIRREAEAILGFTNAAEVSHE